MAIRSPAVVGSFAYYLLVSAFCASLVFPSCLSSIDIVDEGSIKWYSRLYRNQGKLLYGPAQFDWGEQIVVITGGAYTGTCFIPLAIELIVIQGRPASENFLRTRWP